MLDSAATYNKVIRCWNRKTKSVSKFAGKTVLGFAKLIIGFGILRSPSLLFRGACHDLWYASCQSVYGYKEYCQKVQYRLVPFIW